MSDYIRNDKDEKIVKELTTDLEAELGIKPISRRTVKKTVRKPKRKAEKKSDKRDAVPKNEDYVGQTSNVDQSKISQPDKKKTRTLDDDAHQAKISNVKSLDETNEIDDEIDEVWLDISGIKDDSVLAGRYQASNLGRIRNAKTKYVLAHRMYGRYHGVILYDHELKPYNYSVHTLVASTFIPTGASEKLLEVDHINRNIFDNSAKNLRWITHKGNYHAYLEEKEEKYKPVLQFSLDGVLVKEWMNPASIFNEHPNYAPSSVYACLNLKETYKTAYGYRWEFKFPKPPEKFAEDEVFKNIGTIDGCDFSMYIVSTYGQIRSLFKHKLLKPNDLVGYNCVTLVDRNTSDKYTVRVHRMVAFTFVEGRTTDRNKVNHIDRNKRNNHYTNLEWVTPKENSEHALAKKVNQLDPKTRKIINTFKSIVAAAEYLRLSKQASGHISKVCKGRAKLCQGFAWEYAPEDQEVTTELTTVGSLKSLPGEIWKDIKGYEDSYEISNKGRVWSKRFQIIMRSFITTDNVYAVNLMKNCKHHYPPIHRLLAIHFIDNPSNFKVVIHIDKNKLNNSLDNLRWVRTYNFKTRV